MLGRRNHLIESPVNPITDLELVLKRLEVNIAGPGFDRLHQNQVEKLDHGEGFLVKRSPGGEQARS